MSSTLKKLLSIKSVGFIPGVCLLVNALTGPSMPFVSDNFTTAGWLFPSLFFFIFSIVAALSALFIVEAMQAIPGNSHFQGTVEFATLVYFTNSG